MRHRIRTGWRSVAASVAVAAMVSCVARSDDEPVFVQEPGTIVGELVVRIADFEDGHTERMYALRNAEGVEQRLVFPSPPDVAPGTIVKVWGHGESDGIAVDKLQAAPDSLAAGGAEPLGSVSSRLTDPTPQAPWIFCTAVVAINNAQVPTNLSVAAVEDIIHTGAKSASAYIVENSYGRNSYGGKTYGPFNYSMSGCDFQGLGNAIRPMIADKCDYYGYLMAPTQKACDWAGIANLGTGAKPQKDAWYNATDIGTIVQENAHNMGLDHASAITCTPGPFADDLSGCKHDEYGDHFDVMGLGQRHMHVWPKRYLGWFGGCNYVKVTSSGTFNLLPIEAACDGVQALQIPFPGGKTRPFAAGGNITLTSYYLEYRSSLGLDSGMTPQVFLHTAPNPLASNSQTNPHSWLINASGNSKNPGLVAGGSFSDPAGGLTITVTAIDSQKATVQIDYPGGTGAPACLDGTSLTPPGPVDCTGTATPDGGTGPIPDSGSAGAGGGGRDAGGTGGGRDAGSHAGAGGQGGASGGPVDAGANGGSAGATSSGGAAGSATAGSGGAFAGSAGSIQTGGGGPSRRSSDSGDLQGGCSCRVGAPSTPSRAPFVALALGLASSLIARRRKRRHGGQSSSNGNM
jgi:MYXO-CTERM domain-containing protein